MTKKTEVGKQIKHIIMNTLLFLLIAGIAVGIDLAASAVKGFGVSAFTYKLLEITSEAMLVCDLFAFAVCMCKSVYDFIKETLK